MTESPSEMGGERHGGPIRRCPDCGGPLSEPISGDVHCYVACEDCDARFTLDDPRLPRPG